MIPSPETKRGLAEIAAIENLTEFRIVCARNAEKRYYA